jgi:hypothetical protein
LLLLCCQYILSRFPAGKYVPADTCEAWLATLGHAKVDLHHLYELSVQQGGLDASTPGEQWSSLSSSLSGGKLSGEQMRQLYSQHLLGFAGGAEHGGARASWQFVFWGVGSSNCAAVLHSGGICL